MEEVTPAAQERGFLNPQQNEGPQLFVNMFSPANKSNNGDN